MKIYFYFLFFKFKICTVSYDTVLLKQISVNVTKNNQWKKGKNLVEVTYVGMYVSTFDLFKLI